MPIYTWVCEDCGMKFEMDADLVFAIWNKGGDVECPRCYSIDLISTEVELEVDNG